MAISRRPEGEGTHRDHTTERGITCPNSRAGDHGPGGAIPVLNQRPGGTVRKDSHCPGIVGTHCSYTAEGVGDDLLTSAIRCVRESYRPHAPWERRPLLRSGDYQLLQVLPFQCSI